MTVDYLEVLVEEPSMEIALESLLPRLLPGMSFRIHAHQGKQDLLRKLPSKLAAYAKWLPPTSRILVVVDRDDEACLPLKQRLEGDAASAGFARRAGQAGRGPRAVLNRIAVEELEAWYFGDWAAVRSAYPKAPAGTPNQSEYRAPDDIKGGTWEAFERVLQRAGYFAGGLRKLEAARSIVPRMEPSRNRSPSFQIGRAHV